MKKKTGKYFFEILVIFTGITLGFLFDEWRENIAAKKARQELNVALVKSLREAKEMIHLYEIYNDSLLKHVSSFDINVNTKKIQPEAIVKLFSELTTDQWLNLEGFLYSFNAISTGSAGTLLNDPVLSQDIGKIKSIAKDHERINTDLQEIVKTEIWPIVAKYNLINDIQQEFKAETPKKDLTGNYESILKDQGLIFQLNIIQVKRSSLRLAYRTLLMDIDEMLTRINRDQADKTD